MNRASKPVYSFIYALNSSEARRQYPKRLKILFYYLNLSRRASKGIFGSKREHSMVSRQYHEIP
jgi:hypothetical protein